MTNNTIHNSKISLKNVNFFNQHGFVVVRNVIKKDSLRLILESIKLNLNKYLKKSKISKSKDIHKSLQNLRNRNKKNFAYLFDGLTTLNVNYDIMTDKKVLNIVSRLLKVKKNLITLTDVAIRLDPPFDKRNTLEWHQDSSYFRQNDSGRNGIVLWTPINKLTKKHGFLEFLDQSHKLGPLNISKQKAKGKFHSSKRTISEEKLRKFKNKMSFDLKLGDALLMNLDVVHRSGNNISEQFRMSLLGRFHNMIKDDFNSGLSIYKYSNKKLQKEVHG